MDYGPLTFSLKIGERYERRDSGKTAIGDSAWQQTADPSKWPAFEIYPPPPWNYGLVLDKLPPEKSFIVHKCAWPQDNFSFTSKISPIEITAKAKETSEWTLDKNGLCGALQDSPVASGEPSQNVTLILMGAARLRITSFPPVHSLDARNWNCISNAAAGNP